MNWPVVAAVVAGLSGGLILSVPLSRLITAPSSTADQPFALPLANPFAGWTGFGAREVVLLGRDRSSSNTDVIFTVRVDGTTTSITQIPRDSYIDAEGFGGIKLNALIRELAPRRTALKVSQVEPVTVTVSRKPSSMKMSLEGLFLARVG